MGNKQKLDCLIKKHGTEPKEGENEIEEKCELSNHKILVRFVISKYGNPYNFRTEGGQFHHDQNEELHLLCTECHKRLHDFGIIQRWLDRIKKKVEDLPDCRKLKVWGKVW